eukprot:1127161-Prymnesium_polylepis.1
MVRRAQGRELAAARDAARQAPAAAHIPGRHGEQRVPQVYGCGRGAGGGAGRQERSRGREGSARRRVRRVQD